MINLIQDSETGKSFEQVDARKVIRFTYASQFFDDGYTGVLIGLGLCWVLIDCGSLSFSDFERLKCGMNISEDLYFPVLVTDETLGAHYCRDERINNSRKFVVMKIANYKDDEETLFVVFYNYEGRAIKGYYMDEKIV